MLLWAESDDQTHAHMHGVRPSHMRARAHIGSLCTGRQRAVAGTGHARPKAKAKPPCVLVGLQIGVRWIASAVRAAAVAAC